MFIPFIIDAVNSLSYTIKNRVLLLIYDMKVDLSSSIIFFSYLSVIPIVKLGLAREKSKRSNIKVLEGC